MIPNNRALLILAALLLLSAPAAHATLAKAATFEEKVQNAATIILGRCVRNESRWDPTGRWILTYSTFAVEKTMKGATVPAVTLVMPGGEVGGIHQETIGIPSFAPGSEHVVFVRDTQYGPTVLYFDQGAYDVTTDASGEKIVSPVASSLVKIDTQRGVAVSADVPRPLPQFEQHVRDTLRDLRDQHMRMQLVWAEKLRQEASLWSVLKQNRWTVLLALAGIALATWRLLR